MLRSVLPRSVAIAVAAAIVSVPLLPPPHVHPSGIEGRSLAVLHSHRVTAHHLADSTAAEPSLAVPHGSHSTAVFLTQVYEGGVPELQARDVALLHAGIPSIDLLVLATPPTDASPSAHGPPAAIWLTRGPPVSF